LTSFVTRSWYGLKRAQRAAKRVAVSPAHTDDEQDTAAQLASLHA